MLSRMGQWVLQTFQGFAGRKLPTFSHKCIHTIAFCGIRQRATTRWSGTCAMCENATVASTLSYW